MPPNEQYTDFGNLLDKTSLVEYIEKHWAPLKKVGSNFLTRCPFHDDSNPSMSVNDSKGLYHCFSCKAGGNLITFVKEFKNLNSAEAIDEICNFFNIKIRKAKTNFQEDLNTKKELYNFNNEISNLFNKFLLQSKNGKDALDYLKKRGFDKKDIADNNLGLAPNKWDFLVSFINKDKKNMDLAVKLGLIVKKEEEHKLYDFFRNRIIFPIANRQNQVLGFAGRSINNETPKYINSPESEIFLKRKMLYGINKFSNLKRGKSNYIFIVEGYTDVMMMNKYKFYNVVATMGTALTIEHANEIKKYSNKVILCYDSDEAGINASFKNIEPLYQLGIEVYMLKLGEKHDPCSFIEEYGKEEFIEKAKKSTLIINEYIDYLKKQFIDKDISINEVIDQFITKIRYVKDRIQSDISINNFISTFGISKIEFEKVFYRTTSTKNSETQNPKHLNLSADEVILKILIEKPNLRNDQIFKDLTTLFDSKNVKDIINLLEKNQKQNPSELINNADNEEIRNYISSLLFNPYIIGETDSINMKIIDDCIKKNKLDTIKNKKRKINLKLNNNSDLDTTEEKQLLSDLQILLDQEKMLKK
tara:strand:+ start:14732 stop:16492 length:1761 start_codon:yes stop_codon:yes gene_type:complete